MPYIEMSMSVRCRCDAVYSVIKDMEKYPLFMEDLLAVQIVEREGNTTVSRWITNVEGRTIQWTERDVFDDDTMHIAYRQLSGDLQKFEGEWLITPVGESAEIKLTVDFEFGIPMIAGLLNPLLKKKIRENSMNMLKSIKQLMEKTS